VNVAGVWMPNTGPRTAIIAVPWVFTQYTAVEAASVPVRRWYRTDRELGDRETEHLGRGGQMVERGDELGAVAGDERHPDDAVLGIGVLPTKVGAGDGDPCAGRQQAAAWGGGVQQIELRGPPGPGTGGHLEHQRPVIRLPLQSAASHRHGDRAERA